ncbi:hypothetical protein ASF48_01055 [Rathayibacter sp. Leaf299]|uniref:carboxylate-amine ligase n=1 Tax=Rathayibacter sp. Leaf299 TaxID=1736328 RepID=UPI0006FD3157|nr:glutamate--cysteine ligase [Rathayibacter sp. Leaf299]KQQ21867.1 hypothetical protein ASF48_01055 [Rathayibacter sp. Leaf299]
MRTFGVEEEFLLVDAETFTPVPAAPALLATGAVRGRSTLAAELKAEQIEADAAPQRTADELLEAVLDGRRLADSAARLVGARAVATATSPAAFEPHLTDDVRYRRILDRFGQVARDQYTCGLHVHFAIDSPEEGVAVLDRIRGWLPALLALSANSPLASGVDTGYASYRYQAWGRWPTSGPSEIWGDPERYRRVTDCLVASGVLLDEGMVYFDARLSRSHPTVEVRLADVPLHPEDAALIGVLARALVATAAGEWREGIPPLPVPTPVIGVSAWLASRWGVCGDLVDPVSCHAVPAAEMLARLLVHAGAALEESGEEEVAREGIRRMLARGTGAQFQRAVWERSGDVRAVLAAAAEATRREPALR